MNIARTSLKLSLAAPLALALAACGGDADGELESDAIPTIAAPDGTNWGETVTVSDEDGYVLGNPDAPLKLVVVFAFFDRNFLHLALELVDPFQ